MIQLGQASIESQSPQNSQFVIEIDQQELWDKNIVPVTTKASTKKKPFDSKKKLRNTKSITSKLNSTERAFRNKPASSLVLPKTNKDNKGAPSDKNNKT